MPRSLSLIAACALALVFCMPARSQDSPSLGDVARQAQKDKNKTNKPAAKVITNDDMPSRPSGSASSSTAASSISGQPGTAGKADEVQSPAEGLQKLQSSLDHLDSLDRSGLAFEVLEGNAANFPGRAKWEERLFAAKQTFVAQTRGVMEKIRQITAAAGGLQTEDPNDPRVKSLSAKLQELVDETQQNGAAFQAVAAEGKRLAGQPAAQ